MSRYTDTHLLRFHKPPGMSYSHFRNVIKNRVQQANAGLCDKCDGSGWRWMPDLPVDHQEKCDCGADDND